MYKNTNHCEATKKTWTRLEWVAILSICAITVSISGNTLAYASGLWGW